MVKLPEARKGFMLLPPGTRRSGGWVVERSNAWLAHVRRLARDYGRLSATLRGLHLIAFTLPMLQRFVALTR